MGARQHVGIGQVHVWPGCSLWIGQATGPTDLHAHHAVQVSFGWQGALHFRTDAGSWSPYDGVVIPNELPHAFSGDGVQAAHVFVEPESVVGRQLLERYGRSAIRPLEAATVSAAAAPLFTAWREARHPAHLVPAAEQALAQLAGSAPPAATADPRVLGAIEIIQARLHEQVVTLTEVADEIHISPSRLRHLFVEETGLPFRRYVLWQRLQRVFSMMTTSTLTEAAHAAGFADAAHMTRTFRRMLGVAPTDMAADD